MFNNVDIRDFETDYFKYFIKEKTIRNKRFGYQNNEDKYLFIVVNGEFEVCIRKSLFDLQETLKRLGVTKENDINLGILMEIESINIITTRRY